MKYIVFCLFLLSYGASSAQQSSKSKSKDRFRERNGGNMAVRITNAGAINQGGADYAPAFYKDGVVFVSGRTASERRDPKTGDAPAELYYAFFNYNGEPEFPQKVAFSPEKKPGLNDGPVCFSRDNKTVFLTLSDNTIAGKDGKTMLKICESRNGQASWSKPEALPFNSEAYSCMHPSLSADGARLFFSSDMPGGQGGYDIYVVERNGAGWSAPVNLGPVVNSEKQEIFPYVSQSGTLFFSSNGRSTGLGGFDNFFVNNPLNKPEAVVNLGDVFNSSADDMSFILDADGKSGFFTSSRPGGAGNVDVYRFETAAGLVGVKKTQSSLVPITVSDAKTGKPLQKAEIRILPALGNGFVGGDNGVYDLDLKPVQDKPDVLRLDLVRKSAAEPDHPDYFSNAEGKAQVELTRYRNFLVVVSLPGYQPKERLVSVDTEKPATIQFRLSVSDSDPASFEANAGAVSPAYNLQAGTTIILDDVFPEYSSATLYSAGEKYLDALYDLLQANAGMEIDLVAHTDTRGDARINQELSAARAKNARDYLLGRGIEAQRINASGKGESEPANRCKEGVTCSDEEHRPNNRVAVKVRKL